MIKKIIYSFENNNFIIFTLERRMNYFYINLFLFKIFLRNKFSK